MCFSLLNNYTREVKLLLTAQLARGTCCAGRAAGAGPPQRPQLQPEPSAVLRLPRGCSWEGKKATAPTCGFWFASVKGLQVPVSQSTAWLAGCPQALPWCWGWRCRIWAVSAAFGENWFTGRALFWQSTAMCLVCHVSSAPRSPLARCWCRGLDVCMEPAAGPCLLLSSGNVPLTSAGGHLRLQQEFVSKELCFKGAWGFFCLQITFS